MEPNIFYSDCAKSVGKIGSILKILAETRVLREDDHARFKEMLDDFLVEFHHILLKAVHANKT